MIFRAPLYTRRWEGDPAWQLRSAIPQDLLTTTLRPPGALALTISRTVTGLPPRPDYPYAEMSRPNYLVLALPLSMTLPPGSQSFALPPSYFHGYWG